MMMKPGPKLDALVAEKVMGWAKHHEASVDKYFFVADVCEALAVLKVKGVDNDS